MCLRQVLPRLLDAARQVNKVRPEQLILDYLKVGRTELVLSFALCPKSFNVMVAAEIISGN